MANTKIVCTLGPTSSEINIGDLGVELPVWELFPVQIKIIDTVKKARKPVKR